MTGSTEVALPYLIDGHNLIAALPDLTLRDPDDEQKLIDRMEAYCRRNRQRATLFFDQGRFASQPSRRGAWLQIRFARPPRTADDAIRSELDRIGREAPNWTVVSSDHEVMAAARHAGARLISSQDFRHVLDEAAVGDEPAKPEGSMNPDEVKEWLEIFRRQDDSEGSEN
ncbi:MAG: NYN domain-containing protein [Anaerolineales bacterium]